MLIKWNRGFSIPEVIVSIGIVALFGSVVIFNYGTANDNLAINSAGQEIATAIRQAQVYGLSVKGVDIGGGNYSYNYAYGLYFNPTNNPSNYYIFADKDGDLIYDAGTGACGGVSTECVETISLRNNVRITSVCDVSVLGVSTCPPVGTGVMHITFLRPNPDSKIYFTNTSGGNLTGPSITGQVILTSPRGRTVTVWIGKPGGILVQ